MAFVPKVYGGLPLQNILNTLLLFTWENKNKLWTEQSDQFGSESAWLVGPGTCKLPFGKSVATVSSKLRSGLGVRK